MENLNEREAKIMQYWKDHDINQKVREKNKEGKKFFFLDGPPYVSGDLHPGQMWVKTVKDITLRYRRYRGFNVRDQAGYDTHGLPIENKVERLLNLSSKKDIETKIGVEKFVKDCREFVDSFMGKMDKDWERFGMSLDFSHPYVTYRNEYIEGAWDMFKKIAGKGYLYEGTKTTAFCTHCGTSLAQGTSEVIYGDENDPSIYVAFKVDNKTSKAKTELSDDAYLLIWTTTPWTLPANIAVAVNPKELYVLASVGGKDLIMAKQRFDVVVAALGESATVKREFYGSELEGVRYINPLEEKVPLQKTYRKYHRVVFAEGLVSMQEGSGMVHIAPGHGLEDYRVGMKEKLPIFSPVAQDGTYNDDAGQYKGLKVPVDGNKAVMADLEGLGVLLKSDTIKHSYPHCWRCDTKLVYLATDQWFFNIQRVKKKLITQNKKVNWHPGSASAWLDDVLTLAPDWCVSRQRYWGIPLPIWVCGSCKSTNVIGSHKELGERALNKDAAANLKDLHRPYIDNITIKCEKCGGESKRVTDVCDVWFDSSVAYRASMSAAEYEKYAPVDYILEGMDQLRGWFSAMLKTGVMAHGKSPYKHIGIDGMMLGEDNREMHKKWGNYVALDEVINSFGADRFRLWCAQHTPWLDLAFKKSDVTEAGKTIIILQNVNNLLTEYQESAEYVPVLRKRIPNGSLSSENKWILSRLETLLGEVTENLDNFEAYKAAAAINNFVIEDFSRFYLKLAKKNVVYGSTRTAKATLDIINYVLYRTLIMISAITPFIAESVYLERYKMKESIFLEDWPKQNKKMINRELEAEMEVAKDAITAILASREKAGISLRWPVATATLDITGDAAYSALERLPGVVESYVNAKKITLNRISGVKEEVKPIFAKLGPSFKEKASEVGEALKGSNPSELKAAIDKQGYYSLHTKMGTVDIKPEHFSVVQGVEEGDAVLFRHGKASVDKNVTTELKEEALLREFERSVQMVRKEMNLKRVDKIELGYEASPDLARIVEANLKEVKKYLNAKSVKQKLSNGTVKEIDLEGGIVKVSIKKAEITL